MLELKTVLRYGLRSLASQLDVPLKPPSNNERLNQMPKNSSNETQYV